MKNNHNMTSILLTVLCNQPEACTSDLGDDQSRYLLEYLNVKLFSEANTLFLTSLDSSHLQEVCWK